jgi:hypothetical protein
MRRLTLALALIAALPAVPARAATPTVVRSWVAERVSPDAGDVIVQGGAGAADGNYAMAAVAAANVGPDGRFSYAEGGVFFGLTVDSTAHATTPAGGVGCETLPAPGTCTKFLSGGGIGFAVWWDKPVAFNRVLVTIRGQRPGVQLDPRVRGWRLSPWKGTVRIVESTTAGATTVLGTGASAFTDAQSVGGPGGSVAVGHPPCRMAGYGAAGTGAVRLLGGKQAAIASCPADQAPPASYAPGSTEWQLTGAAAGLDDVPARLVVWERPLPRK